MADVPTEVAALLRARASTRIAIVGAGRDPSKYGNIITRDLVRCGYTVLPVHPSEATVEGLAAYPRVGAVPGPVHIVNFVVPPKVTLAVLHELVPIDPPCVWFQPGAFDAACVQFARGRFRIVMEGDCIMVVARWYA